MACIQPPSMSGIGQPHLIAFITLREGKCVSPGMHRRKTTPGTEADRPRLSSARRTEVLSIASPCQIAKVFVRHLGLATGAATCAFN